MKILYYSPHPHLNLQSLSGYGTHMREMIRAFERQECEVLPVIMGGTSLVEEKGSNNTGYGLDVLKKITGKKLWRTLRDFRLINFDRKAEKQLEEKLKQFNPDLIYERANYLQLSGVNVADRLNIKHILEVNGPYVDETNFLSNSKSFINGTVSKREKKQLEKAGNIVTVSSVLKEYFIDKYAIEGSKFLTLPNAFNRDSISLNKQNQDDIRNNYGLQDKKVIGFVGSIFEWHRIDLLIKAFDKLSNKNTRLLIVGFGEYVSKLKELAAECDRSTDIIFTGKVPREEVFDYIEIMDICTAPGAAWYQSPIKLFEYGALGKPIIAPDTGPVREVMDRGKDGLLVNPNTDSVYQALVRMFNNTEEAERMGKSFQEKVLNDYTWDQNAKKVLKTYQEKANYGDTERTPNEV